MSTLRRRGGATVRPSCLSPGRVLALLVLAAAASLLLLSPLHAQTATLDGFVMASADGIPLGGVLLVVESGPRTRSDGAGAFRLEGVPAGTRRIALIAPGCLTTIATVNVEPGETRTLAFEIAYDPGVATEVARRRRSGGRIVTAREIEAMNAPTLADVLSRVAPGMMGAARGQPGQDVSFRSRSPVGMRESVAPAVILDGLLMSDTRVIHDIRPSEVAWMEVYGGASGGWEVGTGGSGGLIRIQTRRAGLMDAPFLDPERCEIPWPPRELSP